jgi:hypothetical protein
MPTLGRHTGERTRIGLQTMAATCPIRAITADEFEALCDVSAQAFLKTWPPGALEREREFICDRRTGQVHASSPVRKAGLIAPSGAAGPQRISAALAGGRRTRADNTDADAIQAASQRTADEAARSADRYPHGALLGWTVMSAGA